MGWIASCLIFVAVSCFSQRSHPVIITEVMADPTPSAGLPEVEYIELYNTTAQTVSLKGWNLTLGTRPVILPDSVILPGEYIIVCAVGNREVLMPHGKVIGLATFSLTNEGMQLGLFNAKGQLVHALEYHNNWWESHKRGGGFALEMVDVTFPCRERENWQSTVDERGGTPGQENSLVESRRDKSIPLLERIEVAGNTELLLIFDKRMDSLQVVEAAFIDLSGRNIIKRELELLAFRQLRLTLDSPLLPGQTYRITIRNVADCTGNMLGETSREVALPSPAHLGDVIINEILFNPREEGADFVELYNKSSRYIGIKDWRLGNVRADGTGSFSLITKNPVVIPPRSYLALTNDVASVKAHYSTQSPRAFLEMQHFPSYPNAEGGVVLANDQQKLMDSLWYDQQMHYALLTDYEGVSLEKRDPEKPSGDISNWHSASSTSGYATPGYANSQIINEASSPAFTVQPEAFSPDADGVDDHVSIQYEQRFAGMLATIQIYNTGGRMVKNLIQNQLIGTHGTLQWDGTDDRGNLVRTGYYFLVIDTFEVGGHTQQYTCKVVVAHRKQ